MRLVSRLTVREGRVLGKVRRTVARYGLPRIQIGADEGKILEFLAHSCAAVKAVEVGALAGYSACWIARALPKQGMLHTVERNPKHASVARRSLEKMGLSNKVCVHEGSAADVLPTLGPGGPYDFCFLDCDKADYPFCLRWVARNLRSGGIVAVDNAYVFGKLHLKPQAAGSDAAAVRGGREALKIMADARWFRSCAVLPTGEGLAVAVKK